MNAVVLQSLELLNLVAAVLKQQSGDSKAVNQVADILSFGLGAAKAGVNAAGALKELRDQLVILNLENRGPTDAEHQAWRQRSGRASERIQNAAAAGRAPVDDSAEEIPPVGDTEFEDDVNDGNKS